MSVNFPKLVFTLFLAVLSMTQARAQCREVSLNVLQGIQSVSPDEKENKILSAGFDLRQAVTQKGVTTKIYTKCWVTSAKRKDYYEHKLLWNLNDNSIKFAMLSQDQFDVFRKTLDERHPSGIGSPVVVGKMFTYYLGTEAIDGIDYYSVSVIKR